jgi:DNA-binding cell septation regulator SpoVG
MTLEQLGAGVDFVSDTTPSNAKDGDVLVDTSFSPPEVRVFDGSVGSFVTPQSSASQNIIRDGDTIGQNSAVAAASPGNTVTVTVLDSAVPVLVSNWNTSINTSFNGSGTIKIDAGKTGTFTSVSSGDNQEGTFSDLFFPNGAVLRMEASADVNDNNDSTLEFDIIFITPQ